MTTDERREEISKLLESFGMAGIEMDLECDAETDIAYSMLRFLVCIGADVVPRQSWENFLQEALWEMFNQYGVSAKDYRESMN
jgi:hypothetical protein